MIPIEQRTNTDGVTFPEDCPNNCGAKFSRIDDTDTFAHYECGTILVRDATLLPSSGCRVKKFLESDEGKQAVKDTFRDGQKISDELNKARRVTQDQMEEPFTL